MRYPRPRPAFTITELLVAILIIGVLAAIILPVLSVVRARARATRALANTRTTQASFDAYAAEWSVYPFRAPGTTPKGLDEPVDEDSLAAIWYPGGFIIATSSHWEHSTMWPALIAPLDDWPGLIDTWVSPGRDTRLPPAEEYLQPGSALSAGGLVSLRYSNSFVARPALWDGRPHPESQRDVLIRPTGTHEVRFPAQKVVLWDAHLAYVRPEPERSEGHLRAPTPMAFADGHAARHDPTEATPGAPNPLRHGHHRRLHNTPGGVYGIDYE